MKNKQTLAKEEENFRDFLSMLVKREGGDILLDLQMVNILGQNCGFTTLHENHKFIQDWMADHFGVFRVAKD
jgi:uncharacterized protein (UPF0276 family)